MDKPRKKMRMHHLTVFPSSLTEAQIYSMKTSNCRIMHQNMTWTKTRIALLQLLVPPLARVQVGEVPQEVVDAVEGGEEGDGALDLGVKAVKFETEGDYVADLEALEVFHVVMGCEVDGRENEALEL